MTDAENTAIMELTAQVSRLVGVLEEKEKRCKDHSDRIVRLEGAVSKQNMIAAAFGALGSSIAITVKSLFGGV